MRKRLASMLLAGAILAAAIAPLKADDSTANVIHVEVMGFRNDDGVLGCQLFAAAEGFPKDDSKSIGRQTQKISNRRSTCDFIGVKPGAYAISAMHDENSNGKVDTNFLGMPKEGVGASNDAKGSMGPPKFDAARFDYKGGRLDLTIHLAYLLAPF